MVAVATGYNHNLALKKDGTVWGWGFNSNGEMGDGTYVTKTVNVYTQDGSESRWAPVKTGFSDIVAIDGGCNFSIALKSDGTVWTSGYNYYGQLGDGTFSNRCEPTKVQGLTNVVAISAGEYHCLALKKDGTVWAWGHNLYGQLGDGPNALYSAIPVQLTGLTDVVAISAGQNHSLALKKDGTVWAWGANNYGQLGNGNEMFNRTPVQVNGLSKIVAIAAGNNHNLALKSDGTVWAWGQNSYGQLGDGTTENKKVPVQVKGLSNVVEIAAGEKHNLALKSDNTLWAWGSNEYEQLGDGSRINQYLPVFATDLYVEAPKDPHENPHEPENPEKPENPGKEEPSEGGSPGGSSGGESGGGGVPFFPPIDSIEKSSNANLDNLSFDKGELTPAFNKNRTEYKLTIDENVKEISITAAAEDKKADISIQNAKVGYNIKNHVLKLSEEQKTINIIVTAENGTTKEYRIEIVRTGNSGDIDEPEYIDEPDDIEIPGSGIILTDIDGHWAKDSIKKLVETGILTGYPDNTFRPDNKITRAEAAVLLVKLFGIKPIEGKKLSFEDEEAIPQWAYSYVSTAYEMGWIKGYPDNTFKPSNLISRQEFAVMIMRAIGFIDPEPAATSFEDDSQIGTWAKGYVKKAVELSLISGYPDNTFRSLGNITRAEATAIAKKYIDNKDAIPDLNQ